MLPSLAMLDSMIGSLEAELGPKAAAAASKAAAPQTQVRYPHTSAPLPLPPAFTAHTATLGRPCHGVQAEVPVQDAKPKTGKRGKKGKVRGCHSSEPVPLCGQEHTFSAVRPWAQGGETKGAAWKPGDGKKKKACSSCLCFFFCLPALRVRSPSLPIHDATNPCLSRAGSGCPCRPAHFFKD